MIISRTVFVSIDDDGKPHEVTSTPVGKGQLAVTVVGNTDDEVKRLMRWLSEGASDGVPYTEVLAGLAR